jgi:hypothetical protein
MHMKSLTRRVWLPSRRTQQPQSWEASLSSQRSWGSPFRAFLRSGDRKTLSNLSLRSCAFLQNPAGPCTDAPAIYSHRRSRAPCCPRRISSGRDRLLSWDFQPLGLSRFQLPAKSLSLFSSPSRPYQLQTSQSVARWTSGMSEARTLAFSPKGCRPVWPSSPTASASS